MDDKIKIIRYDESNQNIEGLKGKYGNIGFEWGYLTVVKNMLFIVAYKGAHVTDYVLPEVYDGFLICSDGLTVEVNDSKLTLALGPNVSAQGMLKLAKDN